METKKLNLILSIVKIALGAIGVLICAFLIIGPGPTAEPKERVEFLDSPVMNLGTYFTFAIILLAVILVIGFFLYQLIVSPKRTFMSIISIIAAGVLFLIFWVIGSSDTSESIGVAEQYNDSISWISAGLIVVFIGIVIGFAAAFGGPLYGRLRSANK